MTSNVATPAPLATAAAPGKIILLGEHAVVYGRSALAVPIGSVAVQVTVRRSDGPPTIVSHLSEPDDTADEAATTPAGAPTPNQDQASGVAEAPATASRPVWSSALAWLRDDRPAAPVAPCAASDHDDAGPDGRAGGAADGGTLVVELNGAPDDDPMATAVRGALRAAGLDGSARLPWRIDVHSTVPMGSGMGSSAALAVALVRAVAMAAGVELDDDVVSALAFEAERRTHGSPSGIDNAVIAFERPIRFADGRAIPVAVARSLHLVVAHSGTAPPTREMVAAVRRRRDARAATYDRWFDQIDRYVLDGAQAIEQGDLATLGRLMNANHLILQAMRVSTPTLDDLVAAARAAGAYGAKLSGSGGGGIVVALAQDDLAPTIARAFRAAGATRVVQATVEPNARGG